MFEDDVISEQCFFFLRCGFTVLLPLITETFRLVGSPCSLCVCPYMNLLANRHIFKKSVIFATGSQLNLVGTCQFHTVNNITGDLQICMLEGNLVPF